MSHFIIGLTGGIGSGKTTVMQLFQALGVDCVDADVVAREVVQPNSPALFKISDHFGAHILTADGNLNRAKLREIVFNNQAEKHWLNNLLHPLIRAEMLKQLTACQSNYAILVAPLLLENGLQQYVDRILVVDVSKQTQLKRTQNRDKVSQQQVQAIMNSQCSRADRLTAADDVIHNDSNNMEQLQQNVVDLHKKYLNLALKNKI